MAKEMNKVVNEEIEDQEVVVEVINDEPKKGLRPWLKRNKKKIIGIGLALTGIALGTATKVLIDKKKDRDECERQQEQIAAGEWYDRNLLDARSSQEKPEAVDVAYTPVNEE